jgi:hypothetical protein
MLKSLVLTLLLLPSTTLAQGPRAAPVFSVRAAATSDEASAVGRIVPEAVAMPASSPHRVRNALIGGAIGTAAGLVVCTAISNIADDAAVDRFTTCTTSGYLLTGSIGFGAGFLVGWLVSS